MKPICVLALGAAVVGCHLDKLLTGSGGGPGSTSTAPPAHIVFTTPPPQTAPMGQTLTPAVRVSLVDSAGVPVAGVDTTTVIVALGANPGSATLQGTTTTHPVRGVATFADLWLDKAGTGYTLTARATGLDTVSAPFNITAPPPNTGSITVTTSTTGLDLDLDGYTVTVDGTTSQSIATNSGNAGVTFPGLSVGNHGVVLSRVAANCSVTGGNSRAASVTAGQTDTVAFSVTCTLIPPTTGTLTVTTSTTGSDLDPDGYTVTVDGTNSQAIGTNNSNGVTFPGLSAASHTVELTGVASNCTVSGSNPRNVTVAAGSGGSTAFAVTCAAPPSGSLTVSTTTIGPNPPSGYSVTVDAGASQSVGPNNSVTFSSLSVGSHSVGLSPIPANCTVSGANPQTVSITANNTTPASFTITCTATTGDLTVTTTTTGQNLPPSGYTVTVEGTGKQIPISGSVTFSALTAGDHTVTLSGVPSNCTVSPGTSQTATVPAGGTGSAPFAISCVAPQNHAPVVTAGPDQQVLLSVLSMTLDGASFSDVDHDGPWNVTINWGDGQSTTFTTPSEGSISGSHTYSDLLPTSHTLTITVQDAHGAIGTASKTVKIVA